MIMSSSRRCRGTTPTRRRRAARSTTCAATRARSSCSTRSSCRPDGGPAPRAPIVDRVLEQLQAPAQRQPPAVGGRQAAPRRSHRAHRRAAAQADGDGHGASCGGVDDADRRRATSTTPTTPTDADASSCSCATRWSAAAFMCGTSRIGVLALRRHRRSFVGLRRRLAPGGRAPVAARRQAGAAGASRTSRSSTVVFVDMAQRLDSVEEAPGMTYLDNSLLVWTQECGMETHGSVSIPVVTFGSAAGCFKTGLLVDYRRVGNRRLDVRSRARAASRRWACSTASGWRPCCRAMGVPPSEFERWGTQGLRLPVHHQGELDAAVREALRRHVVALLPDGERHPAVPEGVAERHAVQRLVMVGITRLQWLQAARLRSRTPATDGVRRRSWRRFRAGGDGCHPAAAGCRSSDTPPPPAAPVEAGLPLRGTAHAACTPAHRSRRRHDAGDEAWPQQDAAPPSTRLRRRAARPSR